MEGLSRRNLFRIPAVMPLLSLAQSKAGGEKPFGIWCAAGQDTVALKKQAPFLKGVFATFKWSDLEPANNRFDWKMFESTLASYADAGLYMLLMVWVGPHSPEWIYSAGVPMVKTTQTLNPRGQPHFTTFPFYLNETYKGYYHRMIREVAKRIDQLPPSVRSRIICIQTAEGCTGDEGGYKGTPLDKRYELPEDRWNAFKFETWKLFDQLYSVKKPPIHILTNSGNQGQYVDWLEKNAPGWWRKAGNVGHGFQLNNEKDMMAFFDPLINHPESGRLIRARSEMDEMFKGWFQDAPVWNAYWLNLWALHFGLDIFVHQRSAVADLKYREGFEFFSRYAGEKDAATSPGAWCALHDGLDASDFQRFPEAMFGAGKMRGTAEEKTALLKRTVNIAKAFERFGAVQGDPEKGIALIMQNRSAKRMNDVAWNIESGNYQRYLKQIDPAATSQGYWRVGPKDRPYGRFARGFDAASGKNAMYFDIVDRFFGGKPLNGAHPVRVRVVYFDAGQGSWELRYDAAGKPEKTALAVQNKNTGRWQEAGVTLSDAFFGNRCPRGSDLTLVNTSKENTLFHMIEVVRKA
ncbi:MAG: beta-galactosidase [Acidobacteria bacterium]|nr:beta-galactosidase [Acidobacteriota bacterium]